MLSLLVRRLALSRANIGVDFLGSLMLARCTVM
jgi:hypothetical protein